MESSKTTAPVVQLLSDYMPKPIIDVASASVTYKGYAPLGTAEDANGWRIERITVAGTVTKTEYPTGRMEFGFKWSERTTLSYSR